MTPYWSVLWRSGVAVARELAAEELGGRRVIELGCGLGLPSLAAARAGAEVLATDTDPEALALLERNAGANGIRLEVVQADWHFPDALVELAPFDLAIGSDIIYLPSGADTMLELLPLLAPEAWIAGPGRDDAESFLERAAEHWTITTTSRGVVRIHRLRRR